MNVLVLDDQQQRHDAFARRFAGHSVWHVRTYAEARRELAKRRYDHVTLDHDIFDFVTVRGRRREYTGADVARLIAAMHPGRRPGRVVTHSWNSAGARDIVAILGDAGIESAWERFEAKD